MKKSSSFSTPSPGSLLLLFALSSLLFFSCGDDPEPEIDDSEEQGVSCLPVTATKLDANVFDYAYDENDNLTKIEFRGGTSIIDRYTVQYEGDVVKRVVVDHVLNQQAGNKYELMYDGNGKPSEVQIYAVYTDAVPDRRVEFTHDNTGRIATKKYFADGLWKHTIRYEYSAEGNVQKTFITKNGSAEYLASEFPAYDDKKRFYAASPELTLLELYLFDYEPSVNNALKHVIHADISNTYTPAKEVDYTVTYDENNNVKSLQNETNFANSTILFQSMIYHCE